MLCCLAMGCAAQRGTACQLFTNKVKTVGCFRLGGENLRVPETSKAAALPMETYQAQYVKPETPIDRSKNVTLPGWGGFTIPAKTKKITQGFEFHNPAENLWYVEKDRCPTPCSGL